VPKNLPKKPQKIELNNGSQTTNEKNQYISTWVSFQINSINKNIRTCDDTITKYPKKNVLIIDRMLEVSIIVGSSLNVTVLELLTIVET
jgi:hypothetical protein